MINQIPPFFHLPSSIFTAPLLSSLDVRRALAGEILFFNRLKSRGALADEI